MEHSSTWTSKLVASFDWVVYYKRVSLSLRSTYSSKIFSLFFSNFHRFASPRSAWWLSPLWTLHPLSVFSLYFFALLFGFTFLLYFFALFFRLIFCLIFFRAPCATPSTCTGEYLLRNAPNLTIQKKLYIYIYYMYPTRVFNFVRKITTGWWANR